MTSPVAPDVAPSVPEFPALGDPSFNSKAYTWGSGMPGVVAGIDALAENAHTNAVSANESALAAQASEAVSLNSSAIALGASHFKGDWATLSGALAMPASVAFNGRTWLLLADVADVAVELPGISSKWRAYDIVLPLVRVITPAGVANFQMASNTHYLVDQAQVTNLIPAANPGEGAMLVITIIGRYDNTMAPNTKTIEYVNDSVTFDEEKTYVLRFMNNTWKFLS